MRLVDGISYLRTKLGGVFYLIGITVDQKLRFERKMESQRSDDSDLKQWQEFKIKDDIETGGTVGNAQEVGKVVEMADVKIVNDQDLELLYEKLDEVVKKLV